jgi:hypothetical protein
MDVVGETQISRLIEARIQELGVTRAELVRRCGFHNAPKGLRRLSEVCAGNFSRADFLLSNLPDALGLDHQVVEAAVFTAEQAEKSAQELRYRDAFRPHANIVCERSTPEPIWLAAIIGIDRLLRIEFAEESAPITYAKQALAGVKQKLAKWNSPALPAFGRPTAVVINYTCEKAIEFDLDGKPVRVFDKAVRTGQTTLALSGRQITPNELGFISYPEH